MNVLSHSDLRLKSFMPEKHSSISEVAAFVSEMIINWIFLTHFQPSNYYKSFHVQISENLLDSKMYFPKLIEDKWP